MRSLSLVAGVVVLLASFLPAYGEECTATFSVDLTSQEEAVLHFEVTVSTDADRAEIDYNLVLTIEDESGENRDVKIPRHVIVGDGSETDIVTHNLGSGESLAGSDAEQVSCRSQG